MKTFNQPIILKIEKEPITLSSVLQYLGIEELPIKKKYLGIEEINQETLHLDLPFSYTPTRIRNQEQYVVNFQPSVPRPLIKTILILKTDHKVSPINQNLLKQKF